MLLPTQNSGGVRRLILRWTGPSSGISDSCRNCRVLHPDSPHVLLGTSVIRSRHGNVGCSIATTRRRGRR
jgi:hypothetical protein